MVFTGAGLDATLKQLIRDTLPRLLDVNQQSHDKFESFAAAKLGTGEIADTRAIARYLTSLVIYEYRGWGGLDSNQRPRDYESRALTN